VAVNAVSFVAGHAADAAVSDAALAREARAAVHLGFEEVYERHFDFVWRNVRRLGVPAPDVDDAAQEVFLVVHRRLPQFEPRGSLKAWLFGIVARVASAHRRRLRRAPSNSGREEPIDPDRTPSLSPAGEEAMAESEAVAVLHELLDGLEDDKRAVFVLAELEQMTAPEIAEALGVKLNTVYGRLRQARREFDEGAARMRARDGWRLR
jgi:RNA polymerase sigma-70 factor (ECF subfamily)